MKSPHTIIRRPVITEKGQQIKELQRTLVFEVAPDANKHEIKHAVETIFSVKVDRVRTVNMPGKFRRRGLRGGYRSDWKKAYVRLKPGEKMVEYLEPA
jgi:large subunit ribosomal protein L23